LRCLGSRLAEPHGRLRLSPLTATVWDLDPLPAPSHELAQHHATLHFKSTTRICSAKRRRKGRNVPCVGSGSFVRLL